MNTIFMFTFIIWSAILVYSDESVDLTDEYTQLEQEYYRLNDIALDGDWECLEKDLEEVNYRQRLQKLLKTELPSDFDLEGKKKKRLEQLADTLNIWLTYINETCPGIPISDIICSATEKIDRLESLYYNAKKANSEKLFEEVLSIHNNVVPELIKCNHQLYKEQVKKILEKYHYFYSKAKTELQIHHMLRKLKLNGTICFSKPNEKQQSIAFINNETLQKDDKLPYGFVIKEIRDGEVLLEYQKRLFSVKTSSR